MRKALITAVSAVVACACSEGGAPAQPSQYSAPLQVQSAQPDGIARNHRTHLTGSEEVFIPPLPPGAPSPADSHAQGQALFKIADDGLSFDYKLIASNIENITQAHIHCGPAGMNGGIIVWLYPSPTAIAALPGGAGRHDGVLAEGTIVSGTPLHVRTVGSSAACPGGVSSFADVLAKIRANNTYVNVHTSDTVTPPINTGPGDFPGGEIRGQLQ
jgi:CHRD domain